MFRNVFAKKVAISAAAFAVVAVAGIATVSILPALAAGVTGGNATTLAATPAPSTAKTGVGCQRGRRQAHRSRPLPSIGQGDRAQPHHRPQRSPQR